MNARFAGILLACSAWLSYGAAITPELFDVKPGPIAVSSSNNTLQVRWTDGGRQTWQADFSLDSAKPLITAIAVLIITCPCALALAIPAVQVVASGALFRSGVILNAGDAIERLAGIDTIVSTRPER